MTTTASKKKMAHKKYAAKYDKVSYGNEPYYHNWKGSDGFVHKKNMAKHYGSHSDYRADQFLWWRPFWTDNIPRLESLLNKVEAKLCRIGKVKSELYKNVMSFHDPAKGNHMRFFYREKNGDIQIVCFDMNNKTCSSQTDSPDRLCQDFYRTLEEWQYQDNKKLVAAWKKYSKVGERYWKLSSTYQKIKACLCECLSIVMNKRVHGAKDDFVDEDVSFIIKINGRSYLTNHNVPHESYKQAFVKKITKIESLPTFEESNIYV